MQNAEQPAETGQAFEFALAAYHNARRGTARGLRDSGAANAVIDGPSAGRFQAHALTVLEQQTGASPAAAQIECGAGCCFCCHQRIDVTPLEALAIAAFLWHHLSVAEVDQLRRRLAGNAERAAELSKAEHARRRIACGLLDEFGNCSVHPVRPLACAAWHSFSRDHCAAIHRQGDPAREGAPADMTILLQARALADAIAEAFQSEGKSADRLELHSAVAAALDAVEQGANWAEGETALRPCTPGLPEDESTLQLAGADGATYRLTWKGGNDDEAVFEIRPAE